MSGYSEDIDAINTYIINTQARTSKANDLQLEWMKFYRDLPWWITSKEWNEARRRRDQFNVANGTPAQPGGLTSEDLGTGEGSGVNVLPDTVSDVGNAVSAIGTTLYYAILATGAIVLGIFGYRTVKTVKKIVGEKAK